jgi:hypothetical protein
MARCPEMADAVKKRFEGSETSSFDSKDELPTQHRFKQPLARIRLLRARCLSSSFSTASALLRHGELLKRRPLSTWKRPSAPRCELPRSDPRCARQAFSRPPTRQPWPRVGLGVAKENGRPGYAKAAHPLHHRRYPGVGPPLIVVVPVATMVTAVVAAVAVAIRVSVLRL